MHNSLVCGGGGRDVRQAPRSTVSFSFSFFFFSSADRSVFFYFIIISTPPPPPPPPPTTQLLLMHKQTANCRVGQIELNTEHMTRHWLTHTHTRLGKHWLSLSWAALNYWMKRLPKRAAEQNRTHRFDLIERLNWRRGQRRQRQQRLSNANLIINSLSLFLFLVALNFCSLERLFILDQGLLPFISIFCYTQKKGERQHIPSALKASKASTEGVKEIGCLCLLSSVCRLL